MSAYNHEKYLAQCLDSVLNQKTDFDFEIILGEDCSTDRTREIAIDYRDRFPGKIKLFLPDRNIGMMQMDLATCGLCEGEYLALLNGDDYWTDENKLQTQVNFLDENPDTVMCFHQAKVINETDGTTFDTVYLEDDNTLPVESLLRGYNPVMTPTVMIRNIVKLPDWYESLPYGDMPLYLLLSEKGKIKYIDKQMSLYRIHSNGQWQGDSVYNNLLKDLSFYETMNVKLNFKYGTLIRKIFAQRYFDLARIDIRKSDHEQAIFNFDKMKSSDEDFQINNKIDIDDLHEILFNKADTKNYEELLNREVRWKVN